MPVGPVHWGTYDGGFLEKVMAVLVAQEHPNTMRREPSSGDGGVDLLIPVSGGYIVEQVKGFTGRLAAAKRRQVKSSWDELRRDPRLDRPITEWHLVVPIDPTSGEQEWFNELVAGAPFRCEWRGEVHWNTLASRYRHVVDYYFAGGRDLVESRTRALMSATVDPTQPLTALDVAARLEVLRSALSKDDPHYRYDFTIGPEPVDPQQLPAGCALARSSAMDDGGFLTILVMPRHRYALTDSPITGTINITIEGEDAIADFQVGWNDFTGFGRPLQVPSGSASIDLDAPGGLGLTGQQGNAWFGPTRVTDFETHWRMAVDGPGRTRIVEVPVTATATRGSEGAEITFEHASGTMRAVMRVTPRTGVSTVMHCTFEAGKFEGHAIDEVIDVIRLLGALVDPNEFVLLGRHGPREFMRGQMGRDEPILAPWFVTAIEDLETIQQRATDGLTVPDQFTSDFVSDLRLHARMLRGEEVEGKWTDITVHLRADADPSEFEHLFGPGGTLVHEQRSFVELDDQEIDLGWVQTVLRTARIEGGITDYKARLVPGDDDSMVRRIIERESGETPLPDSE